MLINNIDTDRLLNELSEAGININIDYTQTPEEIGNYIIHQYNLHFLPVNGMNYKQEQEIAKLVYGFRKSRGQVWK